MKNMMSRMVGFYHMVKAAAASGSPGQVARSILGLIFAEILIIGAGIPVTQSVIDSQNLTGLTSTLVALVPVFLAIAALAVAANLIG